MSDVIIIPTREVVQMMEIDLMMNNFNLHEITSHGSNFCSMLILAAIEDNLSNKCFLSINTYAVNGLLDQIPILNSTTPESSIFYELVDKYVLCISDMVDDCIPEQSYDIWSYTANCQTGVVTIKKSGDYRIAEYYRLKQCYEPNTPI